MVGIGFLGRGILPAVGLLAVLLCSSDDGRQTVKTLSFSRQGLEIRSEPLIVGVGVHFGIGGDYYYVAEKSAGLLKELGVDSYRDDLPWPSFDAPSVQPQKLFAFMRMTDAKPLLILGHPNPQVDGGDPPLGEAGRKAFADFAVRAANATGAFRPIYEIWNEWNMNAVAGKPRLKGAGSPSDPRAAANYVGLAQATIPALRAAAPAATILGGAVGEDPQWQWTKAILDGGAIKQGSGLSVHLYNHCERDQRQRTATEMIDRLARLQNELAPAGEPQPIYVTEFGWPTALKPCVISRQTQADNIAQFLLWSAATPWMKGAWVYELKDQGPQPEEMESNFGLFDYDYRPKPAACALHNAIRLIRSSEASRLQRPFSDVFLLQLANGQDMKLVAWTTSDAIKAKLSFAGGAAADANLLCGDQKRPDEEGFQLGAEPLIINFKAADTVALDVRLVR